jgi:hypothetical protein
VELDLTVVRVVLDTPEKTAKQYWIRVQLVLVRTPASVPRRQMEHRSRANVYLDGREILALKK